MKPPILDRLNSCQRILLAGAGGGFDVFSGLPLFNYLRAQGKEVHLASLSFSDLLNSAGEKMKANYLKVGPDTKGNDEYFPERYLSEWYAQRDIDVPVYCFYGSGARTVLNVYQELRRELDFDTVILVDGGTDSLMRGDEPGLGSPAEDVASIAAVHMLDVPNKLLMNLGFGVDTFHGVCHGHVLEAVADLTKSGDFLGAFSLLPGMPEFEEFVEATDYVCAKMPGKESIVATSIVAAGQGEFGDFHPTPRTNGEELFINPLMSMYWCFELEAIANRCLYLDYILDTHSRWDVHRALSNYLYTVTPREWMNIPL